MNAALDKRLKILLASPLYVVMDQTLAGMISFAEIARRVFNGGGRVLQLRAKSTPFDDLVAAGRGLVAIAREYEALLIVNDNPYLAREIGADGVHIGQNDVSPEIARDIVGDGMIVGLSTHNINQVIKAQKRPVDYIAVGPVFSTSTKSDAEPTVGVDVLRWAAQHSTHPVVAIGGIGSGNIEAVAQAGADSIAVISAVMSAPDMARATADLQEQIRSVRKIQS